MNIKNYLEELMGLNKQYCNFFLILLTVALFLGPMFLVSAYGEEIDSISTVLTTLSILIIPIGGFFLGVSLHNKLDEHIKEEYIKRNVTFIQNLTMNYDLKNAIAIKVSGIKTSHNILLFLNKEKSQIIYTEFKGLEEIDNTLFEMKDIVVEEKIFNILHNNHIVLDFDNTVIMDDNDNVSFSFYKMSDFQKLKKFKQNILKHKTQKEN